MSLTSGTYCIRTLITPHQDGTVSLRPVCEDRPDELPLSDYRCLVVDEEAGISYHPLYPMIGEYIDHAGGKSGVAVDCIRRPAYNTGKADSASNRQQSGQEIPMFWSITQDMIEKQIDTLIAQSADGRTTISAYAKPGSQTHLDNIPVQICKADRDGEVFKYLVPDASVSPVTIRATSSKITQDGRLSQNGSTRFSPCTLQFVGTGEIEFSDNLNSRYIIRGFAAGEVPQHTQVVDCEGILVKDIVWRFRRVSE